MALHKWEHYIYDNSLESFKYLRYVIDNTLQILFLFLARGANHSLNDIVSY